MSTKLSSILLVAAIATAVGLAGCGGSSDSTTQVTVKAGSLSKAEFVRRANAICAAVRGNFEQQYVAFLKANKPQGANEEEFVHRVIETVIAPNYEKRMVTGISALGAPQSEVADASAFLEAVQQRLEELRANPQELTSTPYPFKTAAAVAQAKGFAVCAKSFG